MSDYVRTKLDEDGAPVYDQDAYFGVGEEEIPEGAVLTAIYLPHLPDDLPEESQALVGVDCRWEALGLVEDGPHAGVRMCRLLDPAVPGLEDVPFFDLHAFRVVG